MESGYQASTTQNPDWPVPWRESFPAAVSDTFSPCGCPVVHVQQGVRQEQQLHNTRSRMFSSIYNMMTDTFFWLLSCSLPLAWYLSRFIEVFLQPLPLFRRPRLFSLITLYENPPYNKGNGCRKFAVNFKLLYANEPRVYFFFLWQ